MDLTYYKDCEITFKEVIPIQNFAEMAMSIKLMRFPYYAKC